MTVWSFMEINLRQEEKVKLVIDGTCEYNVWGERNEEGTMIIKSDVVQKGDEQ